MSSSDLRTYVSDKLHEVLGFSEGAIADYALALAKRAKSVSELRNGLKDMMPDSEKTATFLRELHARASSKTVSSTSSGSKRRRRETNADLIRKSQSYDLVLSDEDDHNGSGSTRKKARKKKKKKKKRRVAEMETEREEEDDTVIRRGARERRERKIEEMKQKELNEEDIDQIEKEKFEQRLLARDEAKTKHLASTTIDAKKPNPERGNMTREEQKKNIDRLRVLSRRSYLNKREARELELLEREIKEERFLFHESELSAAERKALENKEKLLRAAKMRIELETEEDRYRLPDAEGERDRSKKMDVLTARYDDGATKEKSVQEEWEETQDARAKASYGSRDKKKQGDEYEMLFEDQIEFISEKLEQGAEVIEKEEEVPTEAERAKKAARSLKEVRESLPIFAYRDELLKTIDEHQVVIVVGETGSGKTTQLLQYTHEAGYTRPPSGDRDAVKVLCTQPRRVAAMSVAARVAQEMGVKLGNEVGYSIRFEDCTSEKTLISFVTDGMLLRIFLTSPDMKDYSVVMVDEAHERSLHTDILLGLLKDVCRFRDDFKVIISSATVDAESFSTYFDDAPVFVIPGRMYPIDIMYTKNPEADYLDACVLTALQIHVTQKLPGDVLVFLSGQAEIEAAELELKNRSSRLGSKIPELIICPVYSTMPSDKQALIFNPTPDGARKVVLATNIAETSLTIDGIVYVIDPGFSKQTSYNPRTGMSSLIVTPVSKASANQRAGRAGRTGPGKCFRLYTAWSFKNELEDNTVPEIQRTNLSSVVLMLKSLGINDLINFDFLDAPPAETLIRSLEQLYALGMLNSRGELTKLGRRCAEFPSDPQLSKMIIGAERYGVVDEAITIAAMLDVNNAVFYRPKDKKVLADTAKMRFARGNYGDHIALLRVYKEWEESGFSRQWCLENFIQDKTMKRARDIREQLVGLCDRVELELTSKPTDTDAILKTISSGFFYNLAQIQKNGNYRSVKHAHSVNIHPQSTLFKHEPPPRWLIYHELVFTTKEYMRQVIPIQSEWLIEIAPHYYKAKELEDSTNKKLPKAQGKSSSS